MRPVLPFLLVGFLAGSTHAEIVTIPHPSADFAKEKTVIWSPVFQAAWDALNSTKGSLPSKIEPPDEMMTALDSCRWDATAVMPRTGWKAWGGPATPAFLEGVNKEAAFIRGQARDPFTLGRQEGRGGLVGFALLNREVHYSQPLYRSTKSALEFTASSGPFPASYFGSAGAASARFLGIVEILSHQPGEKSQAVRIRCRDTDETVILYMPPVSEDMASACTSVKKLIDPFKLDPGKFGAADDTSLHENDELKIPYLKLKSTWEFQGLSKPSRYYADDPTPWKIVRAEQRTEFELHEKGARVYAEAAAGGAPFGGPLPPVPRKFIFDRPFFVFLWRGKAEWPYFAAWIGDSSALQAFKPQ